ncbi:hypothetical protein [Endozoicomonas ascidiicola]|uniref:hypothetical protein n=1 Tax=Endozoicomonas ascidiicola TaxID=1698521 RepID=UPI00082F91F3|nr:hypothetical protein [Endozoicomonas ascidiicola]
MPSRIPQDPPRYVRTSSLPDEAKKPAKSKNRLLKIIGSVINSLLSWKNNNTPEEIIIFSRKTKKQQPNLWIDDAVKTNRDRMEQQEKVPHYEQESIPAESSKNQKPSPPLSPETQLTPIERLKTFKHLDSKHTIKKTGTSDEVSSESTPKKKRKAPPPKIRQTAPNFISDREKFADDIRSHNKADELARIDEELARIDEETLTIEEKRSRDLLLPPPPTEFYDAPENGIIYKPTPPAQSAKPKQDNAK